MLNNDQVSSAIWFFIGLLVIIFSIPYGLGELRAPHTGFMPFLTGLAICTLSVIGFIGATLERKAGKKWTSLVKGVKWSKPLVAMIALFVFALILDTLGFIVSTALLVGFLLRAVEPQKWFVVILGATLISLTTYVIFQVLLETQLPAGILKFR